MTKVPHVCSIINHNDSVIVSRKDSFEIFFVSSTGRLKITLHDSRIVSREDPIIEEPSVRIKDIYNCLGVAAAAHGVDVQFKEPCHAGQEGRQVGSKLDVIGLVGCLGKGDTMNVIPLAGQGFDVGIDGGMKDGLVKVDDEGKLSNVQ